ncbi:retinol dehydrogenase 13-like [Diorhabda carinulata]|uniref:retinol dehydrogenase 13-like n=1 Tax=Diorhabda carinulata TaxID=1163345 RepID=UPI0025A20269|nr:retinol dehydrogenase 13-like [Diorhabda carinulata]
MSTLVIMLLILLIAVLAYLIIFFKFGYVYCDSKVCLVGKTALVTGGSSGIGYELALQLASRGCKVIIADKIVKEEIKTSIINETHNPNIKLEYVDFGSFQSIRNFAEKLKITEDKLDILMNNVGIGKAPERPSEDGLNLTMQINHYSPFLLTHLLIDLLKNSSDARIVFTTSSASFLHVMTPDSVTNDNIKLSKYRMNDYSCAKFCTVVSSDIFAEKLKKYNISCNTYHPGVAKTTFFENTLRNVNTYSFTDWWAYWHIMFLKVFVGVTPRQASQAAMKLAVSNEFKNVTGLFYGKYLPNLRPKLADNKDFCRRIWSVSEKVVGLKANEKL